MFGVDSGELFIIVLIAVVVIGPKDLPRVMRTVGHWVGKARGMANQFRSGVDQMVRESEIAELEQKWREQNEAVMRAHPAAPPVSDWGLPPPPDAPASLDRPVSLDKPDPAAPAPPSLSKPAAPPLPRDEAVPAAAPAQAPSAIPPLVAPVYPAPRSTGGEAG
jgi:sec-independent protein translocase protein TatB